MKLNEVYTPAILLDLDVLENNIRRFADAAARNGKQLWPMVKTHKSTRLAAMQREAGAAGFLCGTLDEVEALAAAGFSPLMYAYPAADPVSIGRLIRVTAGLQPVGKPGSILLLMRHAVSLFRRRISFRASSVYTGEAACWQLLLPVPFIYETEQSATARGEAGERENRADQKRRLRHTKARRAFICSAGCPLLKKWCFV